jgi:hypothetical protein
MKYFINDLVIVRTSALIKFPNPKTLRADFVIVGKKW